MTYLVKKKDNIYDINTLNNSKYSFLHQKDQFLKTFICLPGSGFQITNDNHGYNLVEKAFDNDNDTEFLNITSEEINYLKDHPPHFHSCYCNNHDHNQKHRYPFIYFHNHHIQKESFDQHYNKEHVSNLIDTGIINDSNTLNPREHYDYPNFKKNNNHNLNSFSSSPSQLNNNNNTITITNTTTTNNNNNNNNNNL